MKENPRHRLYYQVIAKWGTDKDRDRTEQEETEIV